MYIQLELFTLDLSLFDGQWFVWQTNWDKTYTCLEHGAGLVPLRNALVFTACMWEGRPRNG